MKKPAIEGGAPEREVFLPFYRPLIGKEEKDEVLRVLDSGWLTTGKLTIEFEDQFKKYIGSKHALAVNSCTSALFLLLKAMGIKQGDEVITSPYTFAATANVIVHCGAKPVFCDTMDDFNIDASEIRKKITKKTKAIIPVHFAGKPCDMDKIKEIVAGKDIKIIEDSAHALGAVYKGKKSGMLGDAAAFSFYVTKNITTGEGGMITTNDDGLAEKLATLRLHGISKDAWKRYSKAGSWKYDVIQAGFKCNMMDIQSAIGIHQLKKLDKLNKEREDIVKKFNKEFRNDPALIVPEEVVGCSWHIYPLRLNLNKLSIDRDKFIESLSMENIGSSVHFIPLHLMKFYKEEFGYKPGDFPVAEKNFAGEISLPMFPGMSNTDIQDVINAVKKLTSYYSK